MMRFLRTVSNGIKPVCINMPSNVSTQVFRNYCKNIIITESDILTVLKKRFPTAEVVVEDTSGGCGTMYNIFIEADEFKGMTIMKQHRQVYETLREQIKHIHGLHLDTRAPPK